MANNTIPENTVILSRPDFNEAVTLTSAKVSDISTLFNKAYVGNANPEEGRALNGSMPDIDNYSTARVPRVKVLCNYTDIATYRLFYEFINNQKYNQFYATYYDEHTNEVVTKAMYSYPSEFAEYHRKGREILGVFGLEVNLVGTLNTLDSYHIVYNDNIDGSGATVVQGDLSYGEAVLLKDNAEFTVAGKTIEEWNDKADGTGRSYPTSSYQIMYNSLNLYAIYSTTTLYTCTFNYQGAVQPASEEDWLPSKLVTFGSPIVVLPEPTYVEDETELYTFAGWTNIPYDKYRDEKDGVGEYKTEFLTDIESGAITLYTTTTNWGIKGDSTLYALWFSVDQTLTYDTTGGDSMDSLVQGYNTLIEEQIYPTRSGYSFSGWYYDNTTFANKFNNVYMPLTSTVYAKWLVL